jgi:hypothetical protein
MKKHTKKYWGGQELMNNIEQPSLSTNLEKTANIGIQLANNQVSSVLNNVAAKLNIDPNASSEVIVNQLKERLSRINRAFQSPEGQQVLVELGELANKVIKTTEEPLKQGQRIFNEMLQKQVDTLEKVTWDVIGIAPVIGDITEIIRLAKDLFPAFVKAVKGVAGMTTITSKVFGDLSTTIGEKANLFTRMADIIQRAVNEGNQSVNNVLNVASNNLNDQAKFLNQQQRNISQMVANPMPVQNQLFKVQKGGAKMSNRINKSINKFLSSKVTSAKIKRKYSVKKNNKTRSRK